MASAASRTCVSQTAAAGVAESCNEMTTKQRRGEEAKCAMQDVRGGKSVSVPLCWYQSHSNIGTDIMDSRSTHPRPRGEKKICHLLVRTISESFSQGEVCERWRCLSAATRPAHIHNNKQQRTATVPAHKTRWPKQHFDGFQHYFPVLAEKIKREKASACDVHEGEATT